TPARGRTERLTGPSCGAHSEHSQRLFRGFPDSGPADCGSNDEGKPMNSQQPNPVAAAAARSRGRARMHAVTAGIGAAGLAVASVVAYTLPGSAHASTTGSSGSAASSNSGTSSGSSSSLGSDDGLGSDDESSSSASSGSSANSGFS